MAATAIALTLAFAPMSGLAAIQERPDAQTLDLLRKSIAQTDGFSDRFDAEVWLLDMGQRLKKRLPDSVERLALLKQIHHEATRNNLPPELVLAVIDVESSFNRFALSEAGAQGLMQVMPFWLKEIGRSRDNLFDVATNLRFGCAILRLYLDRENGNLSRALARYNGSSGRYEYPALVLNALNRRWYQR